MERRHIADIWLAVKTTAIVFGLVTVVGFAFICMMLWFITNALDQRVVLLGIPVIWLISAKFVIRVWLTYYAGIVIDAERSELSFPASDVENSLLDIITLKRLFHHGRRESLRLASIETVMNETRARRGHYAVNVAGSFGSRQFVFNSKQKRDEFRAAIDWAGKHAGTKTRQDGNADVGGYGA